jgi:plasmid stabilization system protein ParE
MRFPIILAWSRNFANARRATSPVPIPAQLGKKPKSASAQVVPRRIVLIPEAESDIDKAYAWYEDQAQGLGDEFLLCLETAFFQAAGNPTQYPIRLDTFRRILIHRFPYAVYFEHDESEVSIYYVFHCSQNQTKLKRRLRRT